MTRTLLRNFTKTYHGHVSSHVPGIMLSANFNLCARCLRSHYEVLGVKNDAAYSEIKTAFYQKSKQHHPDTSESPESKNDFLAACKAYETLKNKDSRRQYDYFLSQRRRRSFSNEYSSMGYEREFTSWKRSNQGVGYRKGYTYGYEEKYEKFDPLSLAIFFGLIIGIVYLITYERQRRMNRVFGRGNYSGYSEPIDILHIRRMMQARKEYRDRFHEHNSTSIVPENSLVTTQNGLSKKKLLTKDEKQASVADPVQTSLSDLRSWK